jgi:ferric-dicitrate binding protein FerR (iron transport regulator)
VTVLGTHFDINAYEDEGKIYTTLAEGSVKVTLTFRQAQGDKSVTIKPGEQAISEKEIKIVPVNVDEVIAWKEGKFMFHDATIQSIAQQIKRWYDVDVEYQGKSTQLFNTEISRNIPLSKLLDGLEGTGQVQFKLEGKKLVIKS